MLSSSHNNTTKILMIAPEPFFDYRGTPISIHQRVIALSQLGYRVDLLTYFLGKDVHIPGIRICRILKIPFIKEISIGPSWKKVIFDVLMFFQAFLMLLRGNYQVIHSHEEAAYFSIVLAAIFRIRHIYDMHSSLPAQILHSKYRRAALIIKLFHMLEKLAIRKADAVITISPDLAEYILRIKKDVNVSVIENLPIQSSSSVDQEVIKSLTQNLRLDGRVPVVYAGSFEVYQGLDLLITSAKIISSQCPEVIFILIGGKPTQISSLKSKVQREQLDQYFIFTGPTSAEDSLMYLNLAEVLVSPRISGMSIPLKIYTYINSGKAIVATNIEAHASILSSEYAILTEPTAEGIAEGVIKILRDAELRNRMGKQAKLFAVERFCLAAYISKVEHLYAMILPIECPPSYTENMSIEG